MRYTPSQIPQLNLHSLIVLLSTACLPAPGLLALTQNSVCMLKVGRAECRPSGLQRLLQPNCSGCMGIWPAALSPWLCLLSE